jgi:hypothetical protein
VQRTAQVVERTLAGVAEGTFAGGKAAATTLVESKPPPPARFETPFKPLSKGERADLRANVEARTATRSQYERLDWDRRFANRRARGVDRFWANERQALREGGATTRHWLADQQQAILAGKRPTFGRRTVQGHHRYSVMEHPHLADDPSIIYPATGAEHFYRWHGRSFGNQTHGTPLNPFSPEQFGSPASGLWWWLAALQAGASLQDGPQD